MMRTDNDSVANWYGSLPFYWNEIRFKYVFSIVGGNGFPDSFQGESDGDYPFCKVSDINNQFDYVNTAANWVSKEVVDENHFGIIPANSILIAKIGAALQKNHRKINQVNCCIDNNLQALIPIRNDSIRFLLYLCKCIDMQWFINNSTIPSINNKQLLNSRLPDVPLEEQEQIVTNLDDKCACIDSVIEKTRRSIEEYKKLKQSIITEAVTKGIRTNREMKDSGIEWVESIPIDWNLVKVTRLLDYNHPYPIGDGDHGLVSPDDYLDEGIPYIRVQNLGWATPLNTDSIVYISEETNERIKGSTLHPNDVLFAKTGATIGKTAIVPADMPVANTTSHVGKITINNKNDSRFVFYALSSFVGYKQFWEFAAQKTTRPELSIEDIKKVKIMLPSSKEEQEEISRYLDSKCIELESLVEKKKKELSYLEQYKKSLIFEYVTGKKEVSAI